MTVALDGYGSTPLRLFPLLTEDLFEIISCPLLDGWCHLLYFFAEFFSDEAHI